MLERFDVIKISHMKQKVSPEHEFLVLDTIDNSDQSHRKFILEQTTSLLEAVVEKRESESNGESLIDKAKKFASILGQLLYPQSPHPPHQQLHPPPPPFP